MDAIKLIVSEDDELNRLDKFIAGVYEDITRSQLKYYFDEDKIKVNNKIVKPSYPVQIGDEIIIEERNNRNNYLDAEDIPLDILYEDNDVLVDLLYRNHAFGSDEERLTTLFDLYEKMTNKQFVHKSIDFVHIV